MSQIAQYEGRGRPSMKPRAGGGGGGALASNDTSFPHRDTDIDLYCVGIVTVLLSFRVSDETAYTIAGRGRSEWWRD